MLDWLFKPKVKAPDGKYDYRLHVAPTAGAAEYVFEREFQDPMYLITGAGTPTKRAFTLGMVTEHPQVYQPLNLPQVGIGGIPQPDKSFVFLGVDDTQ